MRITPSRLMAMLAMPLTLATCTVYGSPATDRSYGHLNGVLAADAPILFVPVGVNDHDCTLYTKKPLREGIFVDTGIWYRTADDRFVMNADRCVPDVLAPNRRE